MSEPVDLDMPNKREIIERWCDGLVTLSVAATSLGIEPEAVIEQAKTMGLKLPFKADVELFRIRDVNYRANHRNAGE